MKSIILILSILFTVQLSAADKDQIFKAMQDELDRSLNELHIEGLEKAYYIEYKLVISNIYSIESSLGSIVSIEKQPTARLNVKVRVGDYKFDNTNFFDFSSSFFGSSDDEESFKRRRVSFNPDYSTLRRELWLSTDAAYKEAAEIYSKKVAALKNKIRKDTTHDFLTAKQENYVRMDQAPTYNEQELINLMKDLSAEYKAFKNIQTSSVNMEYIVEDVFYMNSEGSSFAIRDWYTGLESAATGQSDDGMPMGNFVTFFAEDPSSLPAKDSLLKAMSECGRILSETINAPAAEDDYSGPVLFTGKAAAELFAQNFAPNLITQREPVSEATFGSDDGSKAFQTKIGGRVLPEFFDLYDDPYMKNYDETILAGHYEIDDEAVKAQKVDLVKGGYLKALLSERIPTKRVRESNGHKRGGAAMFSNLMLTKSETEESSNKFVSYDSLKARMMQLCKDRELPYGIVVKNVLNKNIFITTMFRQNPGLISFPRGAGKFLPTEVYKVYPDGREELVRGFTGKAFTVRSFKDIILAGEEHYAYNMLANAVISPFISGGDSYLTSSIIIPDLLFEDGELYLESEDFDKTPILNNPLTIE